MPSRHSVSPLFTPSAHDQNSPPSPIGVATCDASTYTSSLSAKHFVPLLPAALQVPMTKVVSKLKTLERPTDSYDA